MNVSATNRFHQPRFGKIIISNATDSLDLTLTDKDVALKPFAHIPEHFRLIPRPVDDTVELRWQSDPIGNYDCCQILRDRLSLRPLVEKMSQRSAKQNNQIENALVARNGLHTSLDPKRHVVPVAQEMAYYPNVTYSVLDGNDQKFYSQYFTGISALMQSLAKWTGVLK